MPIKRLAVGDLMGFEHIVPLIASGRKYKVPDPGEMKNPWYAQNKYPPALVCIVIAVHIQKPPEFTKIFISGYVYSGAGKNIRPCPQNIIAIEYSSIQCTPGVSGSTLQYKGGAWNDKRRIGPGDRGPF